MSHVAGAKKTNINLHPGHHSSVNLLRSPSGIIVMSNKTKLTIRKKSVKVIIFFFLELLARVFDDGKGIF